MENYFAAKSKLFTGLNDNGYAVVNIDDEYGVRIKDLTEANCLTYGVNAPADCLAQNVQSDINGTSFDFHYKGEMFSMKTPLVGVFNLYNVLAAIASCLVLGFKMGDIQKAISGFAAVPGRLEEVTENQNFKVFIDYAHTEDALDNVCKALREVSDAKLTVLFGCGGDRDRGKRPKMAAAVERWADKIIVTSDNPRSEDPELIIDEITEGFSKDFYRVVVNREAAIKEAVMNAEEDEIVLVAGKGHENYQIIGDHRLEFNEKEIIQKYLP